jgi:predicted TIM-barrel fold metal-dependent hydrolase
MQSQDHHDAGSVAPSSPPKRPLPEGACDCHIHASDGTGRFKIHRKTHPPVHAIWPVQQAMLGETGLSCTVGVQLMAYGPDNSALLETIQASQGRMRGVAEVVAEISDGELEQLHVAGVRGLRFYLEPPRPVPGLEITGTDVDEIFALGPRLAELGWCVEISAGSAMIAELGPRLKTLPVPIVFEHMAGCTAGQGLSNPAVQKVLALVREENLWVKLTICAMSQQFPDYEDLRPIHDAFVAAAPDRLVWGSNWPHAMMGERTPDSGHLLDLLDDWLDHDDHLRRQILVANPKRLFGF